MFIVNAGIIPSSESDFVTGETKENFLKTSESMPDWWRYKYEKISYNINSHGFRTQEFSDIDWDNSIALVGCSYVFGTGVQEKHTIASYLSKLTKMQVINLGTPGIGNDGIFINACKIQKYKPKHTVVGWTHPNRMFLYKEQDQGKKVSFLTAFNTEKNPIISSLVDYVIDGYDLICKKKDYQESLEIMLGGKFTCYNLMHDKFIGDYRKHLKIPKNEKHVNLLKYKELINLCYGRDLHLSNGLLYAHPGSYVNKQIANSIFNQLQNLNQ